MTRSRTSFLFALLQAGSAGIDGLAVKLDHALLAGVGVDAGEADRQRGITIDSNPPQTIEHRLARLEWHLVCLPASCICVDAAPNPERRMLRHDATAAFACVAVADITIRLSRSLTN